MKTKKLVALALAAILALSFTTVTFAAYKGDINGDNLVNSSDALAVLRFSVGLDKEINEKAADMDADGNINSSDALAILKVSVGIDEKEELPEENPEEPVLSPYEAMIALKKDFPEGTQWNNSNYYEWKGGIFSGGYGCAGFAFMLSDAAFGDAPATEIREVEIGDVRVGDILRINDDTHSVIVLEVHEDHVVIAEGNYNNSVHWGRELTASEVADATYMLTRYETLPEEENPTPSVPETTEEIVALYNDAVNKVVNEKAGYKKERITTVSKIDAGSYTSVASDIVKDFLGEGTNKFTNKKGTAKCFSKSTLTASDIKSATCELNGNDYIITLSLNDGSSKATGTSKTDSSAIVKCGLLTGKSVNTNVDYINSECIYGSLAAEKIKVEKITADNTNVKIVVVIDATTGNMVSYTASFNWSAEINNLSVSLVKIKKATGKASTEVKLSDFEW